MTAATPELSVVLAVRDGASDLEVSCRSVLDQVGVDLELLLVDDHSSDATPQVLAQLARADPRVRALEARGSGLTEALQQACAEARAPLIARQDAGDRSLPNRLAQQVAAMRAHPEVTLASGWTLCEAPAGEELYWRKSPTSGRPVALQGPGPAEPGFGGPTSHGSVLFRSEAYHTVGGYRSEFRLAQDWDLWLRLGELGEYFEVAGGVYVQRLEADSLSFRLSGFQRRFGELAAQAAGERTRLGTDAGALESAQRLTQSLEKTQRASSRRFDARAAYHFGAALVQKRDPRASHYLRKAVKDDPLHWKAWLRLAQTHLMKRPSP